MTGGELVAYTDEHGQSVDNGLLCPNQDSAEAMDDAQNRRNLIGPFSSGEEAVRDMLNDDADKD